MKVLCVCTGNTCRSPMLMALLRGAVRDRPASAWTIESAGTAAGDGEPASTYAQTCMELRGLDLSNHRSRPVAELDLATYDRVLCMTSSHAAALRSLGIPPGKLEVVNASRGGVPDPFGGSIEDYEACAQVLTACAQDLVARGFAPR